jgi:hypothetical protein
MQHATRYPRASRFESWRRVIALTLAVGSAILVFAWAAYLLYWAFVEDHPSRESRLAGSEELMVLLVALVPCLAVAAGLLAILHLTNHAAALKWVDTITLCLFCFAPGFLGAGYMLGAPLLLLSALLSTDRRRLIVKRPSPHSD